MISPLIAIVFLCLHQKVIANNDHNSTYEIIQQISKHFFHKKNYSLFSMHYFMALLLCHNPNFNLEICSTAGQAKSRKFEQNTHNLKQFVL